MSIENCTKCARMIDTDYHVDEVIYQKGEPVCLSCAVMMAFSYKVKVDTQRYQIGWTYGRDEIEASDRLELEYGVGPECITLEPLDREWEEFYKHLCNIS